MSFYVLTYVIISFLLCFGHCIQVEKKRVKPHFASNHILKMWAIRFSNFHVPCKSGPKIKIICGLYSYKLFSMCYYEDISGYYISAISFLLYFRQYSSSKISIMINLDCHSSTRYIDVEEFGRNKNDINMIHGC